MASHDEKNSPQRFRAFRALDSVGATSRRLASAIRQSSAGKYLAAAALFLVSRLVVAGGLYFGRFVQIPGVSVASHVDDARLDPLMRFDAGWYLNILQHGYRLADAPGEQSNLAFYPLYPLLAFVVKTLAHLSDPAALLLVSNAMALVAVLLLVKLGARHFGESIAIYSAAVFSFSPVSFFLSSAYTESTCIAFLLMSLLALGDGRTASSALLAGVASATRATGLAMAPVLALAVFRRRDLSLTRRAALAAGAALVGASGLLLYMAYQAYAFGDPWAFAAAQKAWRHDDFLTQALNSLELKALFEGKLDLVFWCLGSMALLIANYRFLPRDMFVCGVTSLLIPYLSMGVTGSLLRFLLICIPLYYCLARLFRAWPMTGAVAMAVSTTLLFLQTALFSQGVWVA